MSRRSPLSITTSNSQKARLGIWVKANIRIVAVGLSALLSFWLTWMTDTVNNDGILYLQSAQAFVSGDWREATKIYSWPLYSWLIAIAHRATGMDLETVAYGLDGLFYALLVYVFITLVDQVSIRRDTGVWAALTILLLPSLNDYRAFIFRDAAYWACYLTALLYFLKYMREPRLGWALAWGAAILCGVLFRIEGLILMVFIPFVLLTDRQKTPTQRWGSFFMAHSLLLCCALLALIVHAFGLNAGFTGRITEPIQLLSDLIYSVNTGIGEKARALQASVLNEYSKGFAVSSVMAIVVLMVVSRIASGFGWLHLGLSAYGVVHRNKLIRPDTLRLLAWVTIIQVLILAVFALVRFFLTGRFGIALVLTVLVFAPGALAAIYEAWKNRRVDGKMSLSRKAFVAALCVLFPVVVADNFYSFGASKKYVREAAQWISSNTPPTARLLTDNKALAYYSNREYLPRRGYFDTSTLETIVATAPDSYDYVALDVKRREAPSLSKFANSTPVAQFVNNKGDRLLIFRNELPH